MPTPHASSSQPVIDLGRYQLFGELAAGGMATVHIARQLGAGGFVRTVAVKRLHEQFVKDPVFVAMMTDEARLVARIRHPNVVPTLDVVARSHGLYIVMEYVHGLSLFRLDVAAHVAQELLPLPVVSALICQALHGLHAAHEATDDHGEPLNIVHRDVSPQNIMVGVDGLARVVDFGVAKARSRSQQTESGQLKGKLSYMSPEQVSLRPLDRRTDVFATGLILFELITRQRLINASDPVGKIAQLSQLKPPAVSSLRREASLLLDAVVAKALALDPGERFQSAEAMAVALEQAVPPAPTAEVSQLVRRLGADTIAHAAAMMTAAERSLPSGPVALASLESEPPQAGERRADSGISQRRVTASAQSDVDAATRLDVLQEDPSSASVGLPTRSSSVRPKSRAAWVSALALGVVGVVVAVAAVSGPLGAEKEAHSLAAQPSAPGASAPSHAAVPIPPSAALTPTGAAELGQPPPAGSTHPQQKEQEPLPARPAPAARGTASAQPTPQQPFASRQPPPAPAAKPCEPPFIVVDGMRRYKPECL